MFNIQGGEVIIILLLALVILGPEKLPDAMRKAGKAYGELKKMSSGFQSEFREAMDEPLREVRETADLLRDSADFTNLQSGGRTEKPKSAEMASADQMNLAPADPDAVPVPDVPFAPDSGGVPAGSDGFGSLPTPSSAPATNEADDTAPNDTAPNVGEC